MEWNERPERRTPVLVTDDGWTKPVRRCDNTIQNNETTRTMRTRSSSFSSLARLLVLGALGLLVGCSMSGGSAYGSGGIILVAADAVRAITPDRRCKQHMLEIQ